MWARGVPASRWPRPSWAGWGDWGGWCQLQGRPRGKLIFDKRFATKWDSEKQQNEMLDMNQNCQQSYLNQNVTFRNLLSTKWLAVLSTKYLKTYNEERGMGSEHVVKGNNTCMGLQECYRQVRAFGAIYWRGSAVWLWHCWADRLKLEFWSVGFF